MKGGPTGLQLPSFAIFHKYYSLKKRNIAHPLARNARDRPTPFLGSIDAIERYRQKRIGQSPSFLPFLYVEKNKEWGDGAVWTDEISLYTALYVSTVFGIPILVNFV